MFHEWPAATANLTVLSDVLGCRANTVLGTLRVQSRGTVAQWHAHLRGLATAAHETYGFERFCSEGFLLS